MIKKLFLFFFVATGLPIYALADNPIPTIPGWTIMATSGDQSSKSAIAYGRDGSLKVNKNSASIIMQFSIKLAPDSEPRIEYYKTVMSRNDCTNGYGQLNYFSLSNVHQFSADYVQNGSSVASEIAGDICQTAADHWKS